MSFLEASPADGVGTDPAPGLLIEFARVWSRGLVDPGKLWQLFTVGDIGHAGVVAALNRFREACTAELRLRRQGTTQGGRILTAAAADSERVDALLAQAADLMANG